MTLRLGALAAAILLSGCNPNNHPYSVVGESMRTLLRPGDKVIVDQSDEARAALHDGDIIVLRRENAVILKRILAMPGETIEGVDRKIFRNGKQVDEPYLAPVKAEDHSWMTTFPPHTVASGELFVMGDDRDLSFDSRAAEYAPVRFSDVVGKYRWTYWHGSPTAKMN